MSDPTTAAFMELVAGQRGHFQLESGHHGGLWLDLDPLFAESRRIAPFVAALTTAIRPYDVDAVCGPLLGGAFLAQLLAHALDAEFLFTERAMPKEPGGLYQARYLLPASLLARVAGKRVALVDDVMSAGSALRGTYTELKAHGAQPVVAGSLLQLGTAGTSFFSRLGVPVKTVARDEYTLWLPDECPQCAAGIPLAVAATSAGSQLPPS